MGVIADQVHHAQSVAEAAIAEAHSVRNEILSRMVEFTKRADDSTSNAVGMLMGKMKEVTTQPEAQTLRVATQIAQQLE